MKAISIRQPWAWAILHAGKRTENRSRPWHYRGEVAIHASKLPAPSRTGRLPRKLEDEMFDAIESIEYIVGFTGVELPRPLTYSTLFLQSGAIVGTARIVGCVTESSSPWFVGPYGLVLEDVRPTPVIPCRGALGLWTVPPEVERRIREGA